MTTTQYGSIGLNDHCKYPVDGPITLTLIEAIIFSLFQFQNMRVQSGSPLNVIKCSFSFEGEKATDMKSVEFRSFAVSVFLLLEVAVSKIEH